MENGELPEFAHITEARRKLPNWLRPMGAICKSFEIRAANRLSVISLVCVSLSRRKLGEKRKTAVPLYSANETGTCRAPQIPQELVSA